MIRFAPQAAKQPASPPAKAQPMASTVSAGNGESSADLLLPEIEETSGAPAAAKSSKARVARKPKAASAAEQLVLDA